MLRVSAEEIFLDAEGPARVAHRREGDGGLGHGDAADIRRLATQTGGKVQEFGDAKPTLLGIGLEEE
jgi:hypothetical protein